MSSTHRSTLIALVVLLILCPAVTFAQQSQGYTVTLRNEGIRLVPQPEATDMVEEPERTASRAACGPA
jgi:hypothetical protein